MKRQHSPEDYAIVFEEARKRVHPEVDAFEAVCGFRFDPNVYEPAARVLACPVKVNPPSWQHGRVIYAAVRRYLAKRDEDGPIRMVDIGTAKGFSAFCLRRAALDGGAENEVYSLDVLDPTERVLRNTVAECDGPKTLGEIVAPFPELDAVTFLRSTGRAWLAGQTPRVHVAFVDGKHEYGEVSWEACLLAGRQQPGDVIIFDDMQILGVARAVAELSGYSIERVASSENRSYAVATKEGR